jgi:hypothetical protein
MSALADGPAFWEKALETVREAQPIRDAATLPALG